MKHFITKNGKKFTIKMRETSLKDLSDHNLISAINNDRTGHHKLPTYLFTALLAEKNRRMKQVKIKHGMKSLE